MTERKIQVGISLSSSFPPKWGRDFAVSATVDSPGYQALLEALILLSNEFTVIDNAMKEWTD